MTIPPVTIPGTSLPLTQQGERLISADQSFTCPVVCGVPVVFPPDGREEFKAYAKSRQVADVTDPWQIETLAITEQQQQAVRDAVAQGRVLPVDPAVAQLVAATNGIAYAEKVGRLQSYPIPDFRLPPGQGATLLDLGSSWGRWCVSAARQGYRPTGIDPSLGALLAAQRMSRQLGADARFVCGDARRLPFADESFDVVHSYSVLQHLSDHDVQSVWDETARVLKVGGTAFIQLANVLGVRSLYHLLRRSFRPAKGFEVRYRWPSRLKQFAAGRFGNRRLEVDCYFGLGLQPSDRDYYEGVARTALSLSNGLRKLAAVAPPLTLLADSLYVRATKTS